MLEPVVGVEDGLLLIAVGVKEIDTNPGADKIVIVSEGVVAGADVVVGVVVDVCAGMGVAAFPAETDTGDKMPDKGKSICTPTREGTKRHSSSSKIRRT